MASVKDDSKPKGPAGLEWFRVQGFKSHREGSRVDLRALTVLAGANSSGKSSVMQPLLLLKQTLHEDRYDPGPLKLDGPNVVFNDANQFLSKRIDEDRGSFELRLGVGADQGRLRYESAPAGVALVETGVTVGEGAEIVLRDAAVVSPRHVALLLQLPGLVTAVPTRAPRRRWCGQEWRGAW